MILFQKFTHWVRVWRARGYYFTAVMHRYWGNAYGVREEYEQAIDDFTRAIAYDPQYAQAFLDRGILYWRELDHPRRAIQDLTLALTLNPDLHEAIFNRGIAYQQLREYDRAIAEFQAYLAVGEHPHWREYATTMIHELSEWVAPAPTDGQ